MRLLRHLQRQVEKKIKQANINICMYIHSYSNVCPTKVSFNWLQVWGI